MPTGAEAGVGGVVTKGVGVTTTTIWVGVEVGGDGVSVAVGGRGVFVASSVGKDVSEGLGVAEGVSVGCNTGVNVAVGPTTTIVWVGTSSVGIGLDGGCTAKRTAATTVRATTIKVPRAITRR